MKLWLVLLMIALTSTLGVWGWRHWSLRRSLVDVPNNRSSHAQPTPTGAGFAVIVVWLGAALVLVEPQIWMLPLLLLSTLGILDDTLDIRWSVRFILQLIITTVLVLMLPAAVWGIFPEWIPQSMVMIVAGLGLLTCLNFYNFMDGIDALAVGQGLFVSTGLAILASLAQQPEWILVNAALASSLLGLLIFNWPPAKVFMGDAGSTVLGAFFGWQALWWLSHGWSWFLVAILLGAVFWVDALLTLLQRIRQGERWYTAHREHLYQWLVRYGFSHGSVSLAYAAVNLIWVMPLAALILWFPQYGFGFATLAIGFLTLVWWMLRSRITQKIQQETCE